MKLKLDAQGHAVLQDGKPVYVRDDSSEVAFDAGELHTSIAKLKTEAKGHRERAEKAEGLLKNFEGIDDAEAARKALQTVANIDAKKLVDAGKIDEVRAEVAKGFQSKLDAEKQAREQAEGRLSEEIIGGSFARSKYVAEKLAIPSDLVRTAFGSSFKIEEGRIYGYHNGTRIAKPSNPGEAADFDEALAYLVSQYPHKDQILARDAKGGSAAPTNGGGGGRQAGGNMGGTPTERTAAIAAKYPELSR